MDATFFAGIQHPSPMQSQLSAKSPKRIAETTLVYKK